MIFDLPTIWFLIVCLEIGLYIILDGADLGIGLLSLLPQEEKRRSLLIHTVGPIWDANETWLVIAAGTVFGAFPLAYAIVLNALYIPIFVILFGLILRAVSFEFRALSVHKRFWALSFGIGSLLAVAGQGLMAGGILNGLKIADHHFAGGSFDWFSPLTIFITAGIFMSYVIVGYAYLLKKMAFEYEHETFTRVFVAATLTFIAFGVATLIVPQQLQIFFERWTHEPTRSLLLAISALIGCLSLVLVYAVIRRKYREELHNLCMAIFCLSFVAVVLAIYPYLVPPALTIYQAAASDSTLRFMLWGIGPLLPIVLGYNFFMYRVFRGPSEVEHNDSSHY